MLLFCFKFFLEVFLYLMLLFYFFVILQVFVYMQLYTFSLYFFFIFHFLLNFISHFFVSNSPFWLKQFLFSFCWSIVHWKFPIFLLTNTNSAWFCLATLASFSSIWVFWGVTLSLSRKQSSWKLTSWVQEVSVANLAQKLFHNVTGLMDEDPLFQTKCFLSSKTGFQFSSKRNRCCVL